MAEDRLIATGQWSERHGSAELNTPDAYVHGKEDVRKAFRRLCARDVWVACVYNPVTRRAGFIIIPSFIFGALSAVYGWNRLSCLYTNAARRLLAVACTDYFDDYQIGSPRYDQRSAETSMVEFVVMLGPDFDIRKRVQGNQIADNLGVDTDFSRVPLTATVTIGVTKDRKEKLRLLLRGHFSDRIITRPNSQKLFGSARWVVCPIFGRVGLALLTPLNVRNTSSLVAGTDLFDCLSALHDALPLMEPIEYSLFRRRDHAVVIFSDASWSSNSGCMGLVVWCPYREQLFYSSLDVPTHLVTYFMELQLQKTYI